MDARHPVIFLVAMDAGSLLELFMRAQACEGQDDSGSAAKLYEELVALADEHMTPAPALVDDAALRNSPAPPAGLIVATALTSLGGLHLDASRLEESRRCFRRSLEWWPANGRNCRRQRQRWWRRHGYARVGGAPVGTVQPAPRRRPLPERGVPLGRAPARGAL